MPIYEYACDDCQKNFELFVGIRDAAVQECKHCAGKNIRKLISNCSFQLKGTGWYATDYAKKSTTEEGKKKVSKKKEAKETSQDKSTEKKASTETAVNQ